MLGANDYRQDDCGLDADAIKMLAARDAVIASQQAEIKDLRGKIIDLRSALQYLYDEQNGPPLSSDAKYWGEAMNEARQVLGCPARIMS